MPQTTPLGVTYLPGETLWGLQAPNFEVSPNHVWVATGNSKPSGPVDMYEYKVVHVNTLSDAAVKSNVAKPLGVLAAILGAWWLIK